MVVETPRILNVNPPYRVNWMSPVETVGSVLIYRSNNNGSTYSILTTIAGSSKTYDDTSGSGSLSSLYKIQFYNSTGSSQFSDDVSYYKRYHLCNLEDIKKAGAISNINGDLGSEELYDSLVNTTEQIDFTYGYPLRKTYTDIVTGSYTYMFNKGRESCYKIDKIMIDVYDFPLGSFTFDFKKSYVTFVNTSDVDTYVGKQIRFEFVPYDFHILAKNLAALELIENTMVVDGKSFQTPQARKLSRVVEELKDNLKPVVQGSEKQVDVLGEYITQDVL